MHDDSQFLLTAGGGVGASACAPAFWDSCWKHLIPQGQSAPPTDRTPDLCEAVAAVNISAAILLDYTQQ